MLIKEFVLLESRLDSSLETIYAINCIYNAAFILYVFSGNRLRFTVNSLRMTFVKNRIFYRIVFRVFLNQVIRFPI